MRTGLVAGCVALLVAGSAFAVDTAIERAIDAPSRSAPLKARDASRHPAEELSFFGVTPSSTVVEIWPGGGYWTQILAPLLHDHGTYYLAVGPKDGDHLEQEFAPSTALTQMLGSDPAIYGHLKITELGMHHTDIAPAGSVDVVVTFRNLHNWLREGDAATILAAFHRALKTGGVLGIEDHRANTRTPQDPAAKSGYVRQDYAVALIEKAGFKLVGSSEIDANPRDTADWPKGVWTLPPTLALKQVDREKYLAVGEADNFVLKFVKTTP